MSSPCPQQIHHLRIDIDFDRILTIIFPHASWATSFFDHLESRIYHDDCRARLDDDHTVSMKLPKNVDRIHIGISTSVGEGGAMALVFDSRQCLQDWLANSPLWEASRSVSGEGKKSAVIRTRWAHGEFESCVHSMVRHAEIGGSADVWPVRGLAAAPVGVPSPPPPPAAGEDVIGKTINDYTYWRSGFRQSEKRGRFRWSRSFGKR